MDRCVANASPDFRGRFIHAKLQTAKMSVVQIAVMRIQVTVEWVLKHAMDLTEMTTSKDAESDQQQQ